MKRVLSYLFIAALAFAGGVGWRTWAGLQKKDSRKPLYFVDPMHPWYKSDKPGIAPDCGMKLEPVYENGAKPAETRKPLYYRDPKNPSYRAKTPGINPDTGNDLEPVYEEADVQTPAGKDELLGLTYAVAEYTTDARTLRTTGRVALDETRIVRVHSRTEGWVAKTFVNYTGALVRKGEPMLTLYSPELLATQQELLLALKARDTMHHSSMPQLAVSGESLVEAARRRLALWDLSPSQIAEVERTGQAVQNITLYAPSDGYVTEREAFPNQKVGPEMKLYTLADLSRVWVFADIFESDAALIQAGSRARITLPGSGGSYTAPVVQVQPVVEASTRTLKARLELQNPGYKLRPDAWVDVEFQTGAARKLTVPAESVIDGGTRRTVFVDHGGGQLETRTVETGARFDNRIEILHGLAAGERVVSSGAFLLNSESQMRSAGGTR